MRTPLSTLSLVLIAAAQIGHPAPAAAQLADDLPFFVGESITFQIRSSRAGSVGEARMYVEGPEVVNGTSTIRLSFDVDTRVGPVRAVNSTRSWFDPQRMTSLRFQKHERHPLSQHDEDVEMFPRERRWMNAAGERGTSPTDAPLDELSFIYFIRTLPLDRQTRFEFNRHFEAGRNPVRIRVVGRETVTTEAGTFETLIVEMRVRDSRRYRGEGVIRLNISDDDCRLPVRIQSAMPVLGTAVLTLASHTHAASHRLSGRERVGDSPIASASLPDAGREKHPTSTPARRP